MKELSLAVIMRKGIRYPSANALCACVVYGALTSAIALLSVTTLTRGAHCTPSSTFLTGRMAFYRELARILPSQVAVSESRKNPALHVITQRESSARVGQFRQIVVS